MAQTPYRHKRWGERKFRYKFLLRCLINPVTTIKYFNELCHLSQPRTLIIHRPLLPAKIQRPYLYTGLSIRCRAKAILEHYQFVQSFPESKIKRSSCPRNKSYSLTRKEKRRSGRYLLRSLWLWQRRWADINAVFQWYAVGTFIIFLYPPWREANSAGCRVTRAQ